jgi:hypothetical protein
VILKTIFRPSGGQTALLAASDSYHNLLAARFGQRFLGYRAAWARAAERLDPGGFPLSLDLAVNSGCQLSCVMCPLPGRDARRGFKPMAPALFESLMAQASDYSLAALTLGLASEPLLHPKIDSMVKAAGQAGIMDIRLGTNGAALSPPLIERLIDSSLTRLEVSVDAARTETYAAVRPGGDFNKLKRSIDHFLGERSRRGRELPLLRLSFLSLPINEGELSAFLESWSAKADLISVQKPIWFPGSALPEPILPKPALPKPALPKPALPKSALDEPKGQSAPPQELFSGAIDEPLEEGFCVQPWQRLGVDYDGRLWPCCSWYGEELLGLGADNLSIAKAWRSEAMETLRLAHLKGPLPGPCQECHSHGAF